MAENSRGSRRGEPIAQRAEDTQLGQPGSVGRMPFATLALHAGDQRVEPVASTAPANDRELHQVDGARHRGRWPRRRDGSRGSSRRRAEVVAGAAGMLPSVNHPGAPRRPAPSGATALKPSCIRPSRPSRPVPARGGASFYDAGLGDVEVNRMLLGPRRGVSGTSRQVGLGRPLRPTVDDQGEQLVTGRVQNSASTILQRRAAMAAVEDWAMTSAARNSRIGAARPDRKGSGAGVRPPNTSPEDHVDPVLQLFA